MEHPWNVESEAENSSPKRKKVCDGNADGEVPKSTPSKKVLDGNAPEEVGHLGNPSKRRTDEAMECLLSLLPETTTGQYYVNVAGKKMLVIVKEHENESKKN